MDDEHFDEEQYKIEQQQIEERFPSAKFHICISLNESDNVISYEDTIVIKITHNCYCYDLCPRETEWVYVIACNQHRGITNADCLEALIKEGYNAECNHHFLEGFNQLTECMFEPMFGS
jgi:hypothetical protein